MKKIQIKGIMLPILIPLVIFSLHKMICKLLLLMILNCNDIHLFFIRTIL